MQKDENIKLNDVQIEHVQSFVFGLTIQEDLHWDFKDLHESE